MNTPTPTPRTDAAWAQTFDANGFLSGRGNAASQMRDECATLERELETEKTNRNHFLKKGATLERELRAITAERDQLRARAERAEAELAEMHNEVAGGSAAGQRLEEWLCGITEALRELPQVNNATSAHLWNSRAAYFNAKPPLTRDDTLLNAARAERAEAELATERARLDYLSTRGFEHRHHETGDHLAYEWTISSTNELKDVSLREVIDAAMKEAAK